MRKLSMMRVKLNEELRHYKDIPLVSNVTQQQVLDNYYQVKLEVKNLIQVEVERLKDETAAK